MSNAHPLNRRFGAQPIEAEGDVRMARDSAERWSEVSRLLASQHNAGVVYASFDNHKMGDFKPYLLKSSDNGHSWNSIANNLPENGPVLALAEDPVNPQLLFAGTEFGMFFSLDGGGHWTQLKGGMPTISVRDLTIQKRESDLVAATFGRGFYILDDLSPLRAANAQTFQQQGALFPVRDALMYVEQHPIGGKHGFLGATYFEGDNPPYGAMFTYYLKDKLKTKKEVRQQQEKAAQQPAKEGDADTPNLRGKKNETRKGSAAAVSYPTMDQIRAEAEEQAPALYLVVSDASGTPIRRVSASNEAGMNRAAWDLHYPASELHTPAPEEADSEFAQPPTGPLVMPGEYSVVLESQVGAKTQRLAGPVKFRVNAFGTEQMSEQDRTVLQQFQQKLARLDRALSGAIQTGNDVEKRLTSMQQSLRDTPSDVSALVARTDDLQTRLREIMRALVGDSVLRRRQDITPTAINDRVNQIEDEEKRLAIVERARRRLSEFSFTCMWEKQLATLEEQWPALVERAKARAASAPRPTLASRVWSCASGAAQSDPALQRDLATALVPRPAPRRRPRGGRALARAPPVDRPPPPAAGLSRPASASADSA